MHAIYKTNTGFVITNKELGKPRNRNFHAQI